MTTCAIIVAAGRGTRMGGTVPKQYQPLGGRPVLERTLARFAAHPRIDQIVVALGPDDRALFDRLITLPDCPVTLVIGGESRSASVRAGLEAAPEARQVLIHDAARPLVPDAVIDGVLDALARHEGAAPALPVTDALWRGDGARVLGAEPRDGLYRAQTPQGFQRRAILAAHRDFAGEAADDVEVALAAGLDVAITPGDEANLKLTHPGDFARAERYLDRHMDIRCGNGFDVHAFGPGDHVTLCGIAVPHDHGLVGHSDADVGMHALTDAIYGALAMGDIGRHFPPSDPQWKGAASEIFLAHAARLAETNGYRIGNGDVTLICERPKIGPHAIDMAAKLAAIIGVEPDRISVKATTSEQLGFTGRGEGIAALASVTLIKG